MAELRKNLRQRTQVRGATMLAACEEAATMLERYRDGLAGHGEEADATDLLMMTILSTHADTALLLSLIHDAIADLALLLAGDDARSRLP